jgi:hypothetical protein
MELPRMSYQRIARSFVPFLLQFQLGELRVRMDALRIAIICAGIFAWFALTPSKAGAG